MGKGQPEYIAHQYGMRLVSLKFMHAHSGHMHTLLGLGVDLFTDVLTAVLATPCLLSKCLNLLLLLKQR